MAVCDELYAVASGHDQTTLTLLTGIVTHFPLGTPIPLGSVRRKTLNRRVQTNGAKLAPWTWGIMTPEDFDALIVYLWGDYETENADVTVRTRTRAETFILCNAVAHSPLFGENYQRESGGFKVDVVVTLEIVEELEATDLGLNLTNGLGLRLTTGDFLLLAR